MSVDRENYLETYLQLRSGSGWIRQHPWNQEIFREKATGTWSAVNADFYLQTKKISPKAIESTPHKVSIPVLERRRWSVPLVHSCTTSLGNRNRIQMAFQLGIRKWPRWIRNTKWHFQCTGSTGQLALMPTAVRRWKQRKKNHKAPSRIPRTKDFLDRVSTDRRTMQRKKCKPDESNLINLNESCSRQYRPIKIKKHCLDYLELAKILFPTGLPQCSGLLRQRNCRESFQRSTGLYWGTQPMTRIHQTGM